MNSQKVGQDKLTIGQYSNLDASEKEWIKNSNNMKPTAKIVNT